jgi:hypothetical protein
MGREENSHRLSARKPEVRTSGRSRHGWGEIIWILKRNRWQGWKWIYVLEECEHVNEPSGFIKCWEFRVSLMKRCLGP